MRRVLGDAERVIEKGLHQGAQEQFLIRPTLQPLDAGEVEGGLASAAPPSCSVVCLPAIDWKIGVRQIRRSSHHTVTPAVE